MKRILFAALLGGLTLTSCSVDDDSTSSIDIPETYTFTRNGESTVSYDGQTTRLKMSQELLTAFKDPSNSNESLSNMFSNINDPFSETALNESTKTIKSKVAASNEYFSTNTAEKQAIQNLFESWITGQVNEVFPNWNQQASAGVAGQILDGTTTRYVNAQGLEFDQAFGKSLIGALVVDQALNNYLSVAVLDAGDNVSNNNNDVTEEGKPYTTMEHKWDEAYGYVYGDPTVPQENPNSVLGENGDSFLLKYMAKVDSDSDFAGIAEETFKAFKTGRAAIVAENYELRDDMISIIRENISLILAVRSVYYLQAGKDAINNGNMGAAFHDLSEGFGFIHSLRFSHNPATGAPHVTKEQIAGYLQQLMAGNGFWDVTPETLDEISQEIAAAYGITVAMAAE